MKILSRKTIAAMVAGTFMIATAAIPLIAQAAEINSSTTEQHQMKHQGQHNRKINPDQIAEHISANFGLDKATVLNYNTNGMNFKDISRAAFLASASSKSLDEVISHKTKDNSWKDVAKTLGISKEQMQSAKQNLVANHLNKKIGLDKQTTLSLLKQGYHPQDIGIAAKLAKNTNKEITEVLSLKQINNRWSDVATNLGIDKETFKNDMKELGHGFGPKGHGHHKQHNVNKSTNK